VSEPAPASSGTPEEEDSPARPAEVPAERPPAPRWAPAETFRETFLCRFDRRRDAAALRRIGQLLYDAVTEVSAHCAGTDTWGPRVQLRGALADLRHLEGCCESLVQYDKEMKLTPREHRLCLFAGELAKAVGDLAESLEQRLAERISGQR